MGVAPFESGAQSRENPAYRLPVVRPSGRASADTPAVKRFRPYFPALDGVRAIAVLGVVLYHFGVPHTGGGFLGVDVFFVLSGYLITSQLWVRWADGRISLSDFWRGRARRLMPALGALLAATSVVMLIAGREQLRSYFKDLLAATTYASNWWYVIDKRSYFEETGRPPVLQHLWSLAVEEQFYLVWPLVVAAVVVMCRNLRARRYVLFGLALVLAAASSARMGLGSAAAHVPDDFADPSRWYFGTDSHASGLLLGAAFAVWRGGAGFARGLPRPSASGKFYALAGWVALGAVTVGMATVGQYSVPMYRFGFTAFAAACLVLIAAATRPGVLARALGFAPLRYLGRRSYAIYLWHWPIACFTRPGHEVSFDGWRLLLLRVALTLFAAELSARAVEDPARRGWPKAWAWLRDTRLGRVSLALPVVLVAVVGVAAIPTPAKSDLQKQLDAAAAITTQAPAPPRPTGSATGRPQPSSTSSTSSTSSSPAGSGSPSSTAGSSSSAAPTASTQPGGPSCAAACAATAAQMNVSLWGDSVALDGSSALRPVFADVEVHAQVGQQASGTMAGLQAAAPGIPADDIVILQTGNNGVVSLGKLDTTLDELAGKKRVVLVLPRVPRPWQQSVIKTMRSAATGHSNVRLADWHAVADGHDEYFYDGVHMNRAGLGPYAQLIKAMVTGP